jgi:hypothetical protein
MEIGALALATLRCWCLVVFGRHAWCHVSSLGVGIWSECCVCHAYFHELHRGSVSVDDAVGTAAFSLQMTPLLVDDFLAR